MKKYSIIAIERQYASGGLQVGKLLSEKADVPLYDRNILEMAAEKIGADPENITHLEETQTNSLLFGIAMSASGGMGNQFPLATRLFLAEKEIIERVSCSGPCIIVGRCAVPILKNRKDCLKIFIYSDQKNRIKRAIEEYQVPETQAEAALRKNDRRRANFYNANAENKWDDKESYDICLNSGLLGIENCAELLSGMMGKRELQ